MYANVRGLKSKLKNIKMILFDTEPDVAAFVEINQKTQEKNTSQWLYMGWKK